jgi:hypothetical protein
MLRDEWKFEVPAARLRETIIAKIAYHNGKVEEWTQKVSAADEDVRVNGLDTSKMVEAPLNNSLSYSGYTNSVAQPTLDQVKVRALNEAQKRLDYHRGNLADYQTWLNALKFAHDDPFYLNKDDMSFFGLDRK